MIRILHTTICLSILLFGCNVTRPRILVLTQGIPIRWENESFGAVSVRRHTLEVAGKDSTCRWRAILNVPASDQSACLYKGDRFSMLGSTWKVLGFLKRKQRSKVFLLRTRSIKLE